MDYLIQCTVTIEPKKGGEAVYLESPKIIAKNVQTAPEDFAEVAKFHEMDQVLFDTAHTLEQALTAPKPGKLVVVSDKAGSRSDK